MASCGSGKAPVCCTDYAKGFRVVCPGAVVNRFIDTEIPAASDNVKAVSHRDSMQPVAEMVLTKQKLAEAGATSKAQHPAHR